LPTKFNIATSVLFAKAQLFSCKAQNKRMIWGDHLQCKSRYSSGYLLQVSAALRFAAGFPLLSARISSIEYNINGIFISLALIFL